MRGHTVPGRDSAPPFVQLWRRLVSSPKGPRLDDGKPDQPARHVALALSVYMDADGGSCWPAVGTIRDNTGLHRSTIQRRLRSLVDRGWLLEEGEETVKTAGGPQPTRAYRAAIPAGLRGAADSDPHPQGGRSQHQGGRSQHEGGRSQRPEVVHEVSMTKGAHAHENGREAPSGLVPCPECQKLVPALELGAHVRRCRPAAPLAESDTLEDAIEALDLVPADHRPRG